MKVKVLVAQCVRLCVIQWTVASQAPLSLGFFRQEYWNGLPFPPSGDLPNPGIEPRCPALQADSLQSEPQGKPHEICVKMRSMNAKGVIPGLNP